MSRRVASAIYRLLPKNRLIAPVLLALATALPAYADRNGLGPEGRVASPTPVTLKFTSARDTFLRQGAPTTAAGTSSRVLVDGNDGMGTVQGILYFNVIGSGAHQVPPGSKILSATLTVRITNPGSNSAFHRMLKIWGEGATWQSLSNGIQANNTEARSAADFTLSPATIGKQAINVTPTVAAWAAGRANLGWAIIPLGTDAWEFTSRQGAAPPLLSVTFTPKSGGPTASLTASPATIDVGGTTTLGWTSTNATSCTGTHFSTGGAASGSVQLSPPVSRTYSVACTGAGGTANDSAGVTVNTGPDTTPPSVSMTSPSQGATISGTVTIAANAADDIAIQRVQFRLDSSNRCAADTTSPYTCALDTKLESNGTVTLSAVATDTSGNQTVSGPVTVTINNTIVPPGTIRVPEDYSTIQAAINAAKNGDAVIVGPGSYSGGLNISGKTITLASQFHTTGNTSLIDSTIINGGSPAIDVSTSAPNVIIKGFHFTGGNYSIEFRAAGGQSLNNYFDHPGGDALSFENVGGIARDNRCIGPGDDCIDLDGPETDVLLENNVIDDPSDDGIELRNYAYTGSLVTVTMRGNKITGANEDGIQLIDYPATQKRRFVIERNVIINSVDVGLGLMDNGDTSEDYRAASMPERIHVFNNTFDGNKYGITGGDNLIAVNNIVSRSTVMGLKNIDAASVVANTLFWGNAQNQVGSNVHNPSTISGNPLYTPSFGLGSGSPAIDAGVASYIYGGATVLTIPPSAYAGSAPDLGRYESGM